MQRVLLVSQPGIVRDATLSTLNLFPDMILAGVASGALGATDLLQKLSVDLLLLDANIPQEEGCALLRWTKEHKPQVRSLVLTTFQQDQDLARDADFIINRALLSSELEAILVCINNFTEGDMIS